LFHTSCSRRAFAKGRKLPKGETLTFKAPLRSYAYILEASIRLLRVQNKKKKSGGMEERRKPGRRKVVSFWGEVLRFLRF